MIKIRKFLSLVLSLMLVLGAVSAGGMTVSAEDLNSEASLAIGGVYAIYDGDIKQLAGTGWSISVNGNSVTLSLDGLELEGQNARISARNLDLTVTGNAKLTSTSTANTVVRVMDGTLTLNGDFIIRSQSQAAPALNVDGSLSVDGGSLNVYNSSNAAININGTMTVNGGSIYAKTDREVSIYYAISALRGITLNNGEGYAKGDENAKEVLISALRGEGTADSPYEISSYAGLKEFASIVNGTNVAIAKNTRACAKLMNDIEAGANDWTPIGVEDNQIYNGTFDGKGHKITGLATPEDYNGVYAGLFGQIGANGTVSNVSVEGTFTADYSGNIAGFSAGTVSCCSGSGNITGIIAAGGVVGFNSGTVENCFNTGSVKARKYLEDDSVASIKNYAGGVVGFMNDGLLVNSYNTGKVTYDSKAVAPYQALIEGYNGGVTGCANQGLVKNCYSCGETEYSAVAESDNYSKITSYTGGVTGSIRHGEVQNCYYDNKKCDFSGAVNGSDSDSVKGLKTADMTGENALNKMAFAYQDGETNPWLVKKNAGDTVFYPHLTSFNLDESGEQISAESISAEDWPPKAERLATDIEVSVSGTPDKVAKGDTVIWTVTVTNNGPGAASEVYANINLPSDCLTIDSWEVVKGEFYRYIGSQYYWEIGDLEVGETATVNITSTAVAEKEDIRLFVDSFAIEDDTDFTNNSSDYSVTVAPVFTVTVSANPSDGGTAEGGGTFFAGESVTVNATPEDHRNFVNWTENGEEVSTDAEYTFTAEKGRDLVANFEKETFTVTFADEDGTVLQSGPVAYGETPALEGGNPIKDNDGWYKYDFDKWTPEITAVTGDATYTANYTATKIEYIAAFVDEDGNVIEEITYDADTQSIEAPAVPEKGGYSGAWSEYELAPGGFTVKPVYTPENICKLDGEYHGDTFLGKVITFFHNLIWTAFSFIGLDVYFSIKRS